jgi:superfamily II DNA/RNA helicase
MTPASKAAAVARFQNNKDCRLFIASDAGAFGVDLPEANYLFNYDLVESAGKMDQRNARHVRAGSPHKKVFVVNYLMEGSVEERPSRGSPSNARSPRPSSTASSEGPRRASSRTTSTRSRSSWRTWALNRRTKPLSVVRARLASKKPVVLTK